MNHALAASCTTGSWQQQLNCGWHEPTTGAANAGAFVGHNVGPALIGLLIVVAVIVMASRAWSRQAVTSSK